MRQHRHAVALLARHGITRKKTGHATEQDSPDVLKQREEWFEGQLDLDPDKLVFIDETWASTNMARRYGRCRRGERLRAGIPSGHWKTTTPSTACKAGAQDRLCRGPAAKLKAHLRKAAERAIHGLWNAIARIIDLYSPQDCTNYFVACGYDAD